jgi:AcrR family transcriptional regulator
VNDLSTRGERLKKGSASRRVQNKLDLKRQILEAAMSLFETHGYDGFSLRQVAEAIGYSPTTIYLYFKDKNELLFHIAYEGFRDFGLALKAAYDSSNDSHERIWRIGRAYFDFGLSHPVHYRLMFMQRGEFLAQTAPDGYSDFIDSFGIVTQALTEAIKQGKIRPFEPQVAGGLLWASVHGVVSLVLTNSHLPREAAEPLFDWQIQILKRELTL